MIDGSQFELFSDWTYKNKISPFFRTHGFIHFLYSGCNVRVRGETKRLLIDIYTRGKSSKVKNRQIKAEEKNGRLVRIADPNRRTVVLRSRLGKNRITAT